MCLEVAFKTGKSLSRSDGLRSVSVQHGFLAFWLWQIEWCNPIFVT